MIKCTIAIIHAFPLKKKKKNITNRIKKPEDRYKNFESNDKFESIIKNSKYNKKNLDTLDKMYNSDNSRIST